MIRRLTQIAIVMLLSTNTYAQQEVNDSLFALHEFIHLRQIYDHLPVELKINVKNSSSRNTSPTDSMETDMEVYFNHDDFFMKAEGLEEIVNDSLMIMVNNTAKSVLLYRNNQNMINKIGKSLLTNMPDSSIEVLAKKYSSSVLAYGQDLSRIELKSREMAYGTAFSKESISVTYRVSSHQPLEFKQTKILLTPLDSASYNRLRKESAYDGLLISTSTSQGSLFFFVKKLTTSFRFDKIDYNVKLPPVKEEDRIVKQANGDYIMSKGFEGYVITKEF